MPDQTRSRRLRKRNTELDVRRCTSKNLIQIFRGFDEVRLAENDIGAIGNVYSYGTQVHPVTPTIIRRISVVFRDGGRIRDSSKPISGRRKNSKLTTVNPAKTSRDYSLKTAYPLY